MRVIAAAGMLWAAALVVITAQSRTQFPGTLDLHPAIDYRSSALADPITALQRELAAGQAALDFDGPQGFLRSLLTRLNIPVESQILLFSKTGIQHPFTNPDNPRALYFNDRVIVGYIPGAPMLEVASHDPRQGLIFQTLPQQVGLGTPPRFVRPDRCLTCHLSANSLGVPGILVRSMFTEVTGRTRPQLGSAMRLLQDAGVPAGAVQTGEDLWRDVHLRARDAIVTLTHPEPGTIEHPGLTVRLHGTPGQIRRPLGRLGEANEEVFGGLLGLSREAQTRLAEAGVLA
jgi:hypothetical protein